MTTQDPAAELDAAIATSRQGLAATVPRDRMIANSALVAAIDRRPRQVGIDPDLDLVTGHRLANPGGNLAIALCLASPNHGHSGDQATWAAGFLAACDDLALASTVVDHVRSGAMRLVSAGHGALLAAPASRRPPASWRERADYDWWSRYLAPEPAMDLHSLSWADGVDETGAEALVNAMAYQFPYPAEASLGGLLTDDIRRVLAAVVADTGRRFRADLRPAPEPRSALIATVAARAGLDSATTAGVLDLLTVTPETAAWHARVPGIASAPLIAGEPHTVVRSWHGLTGEPLLFLCRELRRRDAEHYNNAATARETAFRNDLYALFSDRRFATAPRRIELRHPGGRLRTDIDAAIFDRKSAALAVFELKSQDPFAASPAERIRQRDSFLAAGRQIAGVLDWTRRHGADEILNRIDPQIARRFRVQKVVPFVLGRYLAHFGSGPEPDRRATWASWPGVLRAMAEGGVRSGDSRPLTALQSRLSRAPVEPQVPLAPRTITLGETSLTIHGSATALHSARSLN